MGNEGQLRIAWTLPASQVRAQVAGLTPDKGVVESEQPFEPPDAERDRYAHAAWEPLTLLVGSFALAFLAERLSRFLRSVSHGGLIIDLRTEPVTIREERALDQGTVYVVSHDGFKEISRPEGLDILSALKIAGAGGAGGQRHEASDQK